MSADSDTNRPIRILLADILNHGCTDAKTSNNNDSNTYLIKSTNPNNYIDT